MIIVKSIDCTEYANKYFLSEQDEWTDKDFINLIPLDPNFELFFEFPKQIRLAGKIHSYPLQGYKVKGKFKTKEAAANEIIDGRTAPFDSWYVVADVEVETGMRFGFYYFCNKDGKIHNPWPERSKTGTKILINPLDPEASSPGFADFATTVVQTFLLSITTINEKSGEAEREKEFRYFEVGKLFKPGVTRYPDGTRFDFLQTGAMLNIFMDFPTSNEVEEIRSGKFELGFYEEEDIIFFLFRFGRSQFMDAPYTVHKSEPFTFNEIQSGTGFSLTVTLVDGTNGIIKAIRYVGLSTDFSNRLKKAVERLEKQPFSASQYTEKLQQVYKNYSTEDLVQRADAWCKIK